MRTWWHTSSNKQKLFGAGLPMLLLNLGIALGLQLVFRSLFVINIVLFGLALVLPSDYDPD